MSRDKDKLIRQLSLLSFLLSRTHPSTAREIQESVEGYAEMSDETFARRFHGDRADLTKVGVSIRVLSGADAVDAAETQLYALSQEDFRLPAVEFTRAESRALSLALAALDGRFAYARPLRMALTSILRGRDDPMRAELEQLPVALAPDEDAKRAGKRLSRLEEAVIRCKSVRFSYPSNDGDVLDRTFDPYSLFFIQGHWYVVGHDHLREAIRTFRLGRIRGPVRFVTEKTRDFTVPDDYDPDRYRARPPWLLGPIRGNATVRVGEDLSWWVKRLEPHVRLLAEEEDGCALFSLPYADDSVLLAWVAGSGGCTELLEPAALRRRLRDALAEVSRAHAEATDDELMAVESSAPAVNDNAPLARETAPIAAEHLARALALLHYLVDDERPSLIPWRDLDQDLGLTRSEVQADLTLINLMNFGGGTYALTAEAGAKGVHVVRDIMAEAFAEPARLSPVMARALLLALDLLGDALPLAGMESLASVREKIRALVGSDHAEGSVIVDDVVPPDPEILETLNHAIRDRAVVALDYFAVSRQRLGRRLVEPYLLFRSADGWYLEAFCLSADAQRTFKLERIRSASCTGESYVPRSEVDLSRRRTGRAFLSDDTATWATVRFHPRWRKHIEERGMGCAVLSDGRLEARVPFLDERWMAHEMIRYLGEAVLVAPASTRERIRELAAVMVTRYAELVPGSSPSSPLGTER